MASRLKEQYNSAIAPELMKRFNYKSVMQIPKLEKVIVNVGCGDAKDNTKIIDSVIGDIMIITGQKAVSTTAKKSVANFKLRAGTKVGVKVTLRGDRMYEFLDRLFNLALPRLRDFKGVSPNAFDGRGNYAMGIKEQLIFPEIEYDKIDKRTDLTDDEKNEMKKQVRLKGLQGVLKKLLNTFDKDTRTFKTGAPFRARAVSVKDRIKRFS